MTQWEVVGVIAALVSLLVGVGAPIVKLNSNITRLTVTIENIAKEQTEQKEINGKSHDRIWRELETHDAAITDHDRRIARIETQKKSAKE